MLSSATTVMKATVWGSLVLQFLTFILTVKAVFVTLPVAHRPLTDVILIENVVQIVEALFYIIIAFNLTRIQLSTVTPLRYIDWTITTPIMLISTVIYMEYQKRQRSGESQLSLPAFFTEHRKSIVKIVAYNIGMLVFGFLGEIGVLPLYLSVSIGFVFFGLSFYTIQSQFVHQIPENRSLFLFLVITWSLYGVAAVLPVLYKNIGYNILDLIAKNFYGVFIFYKIRQVQQTSSPNVQCVNSM